MVNEFLYIILFHPVFISGARLPKIALVKKEIERILNAREGVTRCTGFLR